jgi:hypothetical protein
MKRVMIWTKTLSGKVVSCTVCSWWAPVVSEDVDAISKGFDAHICADHPPVKEVEKSSSPE